MRSKYFIAYSLIASWLLLLPLSFLTSCGGGTTGTSGSSELRFVGTIFSDDGSPISSTEMLVVDNASDSVALRSRTDSSGNFSMETTVPLKDIGLRVRGAELGGLTSELKGDLDVSLSLVQTSATELSVYRSMILSVTSISSCPGASRNSAILQIPSQRPDDCSLVFDYEVNNTDSPTSIDTSLEVRLTCNGTTVAEERFTFSGPSSGVSIPLRFFGGEDRCRNGAITVQRVDSRGDALGAPPVSFAVNVVP